MQNVAEVIDEITSVRAYREIMDSMSKEALDANDQHGADLYSDVADKLDNYIILLRRQKLKEAF